MFFDQFTAVMALIILAFIGTLAVFFRIWRELEALREHMADIRESFRLYAVDMAQQNRDLASAVRDLRAMAGRRDADDEALGGLLERGLPDLARRFPPEAPPAGGKTASRLAPEPLAIGPEPAAAPQARPAAGSLGGAAAPLGGPGEDADGNDIFNRLDALGTDKKRP